MSETVQLVQLQKRRTELEGELSSLRQKETTLESDVKTLEEEVAAQLEGKIKTQNTILEKLESTKSDLERRLEELQEQPKPSQMPEDPLTKHAETEEQQQKQPIEAADANSQPQQFEEKHKEDKKHKWI